MDNLEAYSNFMEKNSVLYYISGQLYFETMFLMPYLGNSKAII